jgi:hypothetical protein
MSLLRLPYAGLDLQALQTITQFVIPSGAGGLFSNANSATLSQGGVCTITTNAAHGLTFNPSAGVPPNYFVTFGGSTSAITGTGVLINNVFRILTIPSTTTFTIWSTISTATVTSMTVIPVFYPNFQASTGSSWAQGFQLSQTVSSVTTIYAGPQLEGAVVLATLGANCNVVADVKSLALLLDPITTPATGTPATAPTWNTILAASSDGEVFMAAPSIALFANGTTATSTLNVVN